MFSCLEKNQYKNHQKEKANSITHAINKIKNIKFALKSIKIIK